MSYKKTRICKAILGPTNTGKTYYAIDRMLSYQSGIIGVPLRLLARELYDKIVEIKGAKFVALSTGEEKITGENAKYWVCTTESMPLEMSFEFLAIDEIQLCADEERGHIFTDRLIKARGTFETLFLGSIVMKETIKKIIPEVEFLSRERLSCLSYSGTKKISKLGPRSVAVDFSVERVYELAEQLRLVKGGAAVVLGALSPKTRNAQVELYQNGDVDYLVATDAIGMGLNLNIKNVFFSSIRKFDGHKVRDLSLLELAQIAGRAGRYQQDGFFGEIGKLKGLDKEVVYAIENNLFPMQKKVKWRNSNLNYDTVDALIKSLDKGIESDCFEKIGDVTDIVTLKFLFKSGISDFQKLRDKEVQLLWRACQIPDFRKISNQDHSEIVIKLFNFIKSDGIIPDRWLEKEVRRLDNTQGDIDTLSKRLSFVRTWCFVANRGDWLEDSNMWKIRTREIEDKLSDALHVKLTQRFVDLRRSVLVKQGMNQKDDYQDFAVKEDGSIYIKDHLFGFIEGFNFVLSGEETFENKKKIMHGVRPFLQKHLRERVDRFYSTSEKEIDISVEGEFSWEGTRVAVLEKGNDIFSPKITISKFDELTSDQIKKIEKRLIIFLDQKLKSLMGNFFELRKSSEFKGIARGLIHRYLENMGVIPKAQVMEEFRVIQSEMKSTLREFGIRFGYKVIYDPTGLKPEATKLRLALFNVFNENEKNFFFPPPGLITLPYNENISKAQYLVGGFFVAGSRVIRVDMLERLFFMVKKVDQLSWFEPDASMLSISGLGLRDFSDLMKNLGFISKTEKYVPKNEINKTETPENDSKEESFLTYEIEGEKFRVFLKKQIRQINESNEKQKNIRGFQKNKRKGLVKRKKDNVIVKSKSFDPNSPFASLKQLLRN